MVNIFPHGTERKADVIPLIATNTKFVRLAGYASILGRLFEDGDRTQLGPQRDVIRPQTPSLRFFRDLVAL